MIEQKYTTQQPLTPLSKEVDKIANEMVIKEMMTFLHKPSNMVIDLFVDYDGEMHYKIFNNSDSYVSEEDYLDIPKNSYIVSGTFDISKNEQQLKAAIVSILNEAVEIKTKEESLLSNLSEMTLQEQSGKNYIECVFHIDPSKDSQNIFTTLSGTLDYKGDILTKNGSLIPGEHIKSITLERTGQELFITPNILVAMQNEVKQNAGFEKYPIELNNDECVQFEFPATTTINSDVYVKGNELRIHNLQIGNLNNKDNSQYLSECIHNSQSMRIDKIKDYIEYIHSQGDARFDASDMIKQEATQLSQQVQGLSYELN